MNLQKWKSEDIGKWCAENNQVEWLLAELEKTKAYPVYPKVESVSKNGKKSWVEDKTAEPKMEVRKLDFIDLKANFIKKFFPDEVKKRETAKLSWRDKLLAAAKAK